MTTALQQALEHLTAVTEALDPDGQALVAEKLEELADELEQEQGWKERLHDPKALPALEALIERAITADKAGQTTDLEEAL
jgi:hypothetical protein